MYDSDNENNGAECNGLYYIFWLCDDVSKRRVGTIHRLMSLKMMGTMHKAKIQGPAFIGFRIASAELLQAGILMRSWRLEVGTR